MRIGIPKEVLNGERRVAATPDTVKKMIKMGFKVSVEAGAGALANYPDQVFIAAGASITSEVDSLWSSSDLICKINPPQVRSDGSHEADSLADGGTLISLLFPEQNLELVEQLAKISWEESVRLLPLVHPWIRPIVAKRNVVFMREITFLCGNLDTVLMCDYVFGLPMLGWARHSTTMLQRTTRPPRAELPTPAENKAQNAIALARVKPSRDPEADVLSWHKTKAEFEKETMIGPFYSIEDLPGNPSLEDVRILNRFGIMERHGGAEEASVRNIDDGKARGHNLDSANTATHRPADLDAVGSLSRRVAERFPDHQLAGFPSDFSGAYRQATADPGQAKSFVVASWDTDWKAKFSSWLSLSCLAAEMPLSTLHAFRTGAVGCLRLFSKFLRYIALTT